MTPCREWIGAKTEGYGAKWDKVKRKRVLVHRWVVAQIDGWEAIEGKVVMHSCDNRACYRYEHLRIGTQQENLADMNAKGRNGYSKRTHCPSGHEYTDENTYQYGNNRQCKTCAIGRKSNAKTRTDS